jgi:hypothetical protein
MFYDFTYENMLIYRKPPFYYDKEEIETAREHPAIIHFTTSFLSRRAWIEGSRHPYAKKWLDYKEISPWREEAIRKNTPKWWGKAYIKFYKILPDKLSVWVSGLLQAYGRPISQKIKYRIRY